MGGIAGVEFVGIFFDGGTAGTLNFQWAQNTTKAVNLLLKKGPCLRITKLH